MRKIKELLSKVKVQFYYIRYRIAGWRSERLCRKWSHALCVADDKRREYEIVRYGRTEEGV